MNINVDSVRSLHAAVTPAFEIGRESAAGTIPHPADIEKGLPRDVFGSSSRPRTLLPWARLLQILWETSVGGCVAVGGS